VLASRPFPVYTPSEEKTIVEPTPEQMEAYRATARRRAEEERRRLEQRHERAWAVAHQAAALLRSEFGAQRVLAFGSLVRGDDFYSRSDIDLCAWGIAERDYYRAAGRLLGLDPEFEIDLVRGEEAPQKLLDEIEKEGIPL